MRAKLYLETTIPSYLVGRPSRDLIVATHQEITRNWWESRRSNFELYISELVVQEVRAGDSLLANQRMEIIRDIPILPVSSEILTLAEDLITEGSIPQKAADDAAHIAIATVYGCEYLLELPPYRQRRAAPGNQARYRRTWVRGAELVHA
jgi:hypothetical protein